MRSALVWCSAVLVLSACATNRAAPTRADAPAPTATTTSAPVLAVAPTLAPTGAVAATLTSPAQRIVRFGVTRDFGGEMKCDDLKALGARATWGSLQWEWVEPAQNVWKFESADAAVAQANACGWDVGIKLRTEQGHWAVQPVKNPQDAEYNKEHKRGSRPPKNMDDYYDWVYTVASRYKGRVRAYAIENEVNTPTFWLGTYDEYEAMLATAYRAIKAADSNALVLDSGMASMTYSAAVARWKYERGDVAGALDWLNRYVARRTEQQAQNEQDLRKVLYDEQTTRAYEIMLRHFQKAALYDVYQLHFYESWEMLPELMQWIKERMAENGGVKPIEVWEVGYAFANTARYDAQAHGRDTAKVLATALGEDAERVYYLPYYSARAKDGIDEMWWALVDLQYKARPAYDAYVKTAAALDGFAAAKQLRAGPTEWTYQFDNTIVRWSKQGEVSFEKQPLATPTVPPIHASPASGNCREEKIAREKTGGKTAGYLFMPIDGAAQHPVAVTIHGGFADKPQAADSTTRASGLNVSSRLCPLGFAVFSVDYRWSAFGMEEMEDVTGAYDYLMTRTDIDPKRIVVMGDSHGGYMTMMAVSVPKSKRPFALAINLYGFVDIGNLVQAPSVKNNPQVQLTIQKLGTPNANPSAYRDISPRYYIANLNVPLLIVIGTRDPLLEQLRPFSVDLKKTGKDLQYHEVENAEHGFIQGQEPYTTTLWNYVTAFLRARSK